MAQDIILDNDYNAQIANGDFVVGNSDMQHIELLGNSNKGEWRESPLVGMGLRNYLNGSASSQEIKRLIKSTLENDGFINVSVMVDTDFNINIDAVFS